MQLTKFRVLLMLILAVTSSSLLVWHFTSAISAPTINSKCEPGGCASGAPFSFNVYTDGSSYLAAKSRGGGNAYSETDFRTLINTDIEGDAACSSGCSIFLQPATYTLSLTTLRSQQVGLIINDNILIKGSGIGQSIIKVANSAFTGGTQAGAIIANANWGLGATNPNFNITLTDLTLDGNLANQGVPTTGRQFGILYSPVITGTIQNVEVKNVYSISIGIYSAEYVGGANRPVNDVIDHVWIHDGGNGQAGTNFDSGVFFSYHRKNGSILEASSIYNMNGYGVMMEDVPGDIKIQNNNIYSNKGDGIRLILAAASIPDSNMTIISHNQIWLNGGLTNLGTGIYAVPAGTGMMIDHNYVAKNNRWGILVQAQYVNVIGASINDNFVVDNNQLLASLPGIQVQGTSGTEQLQKVRVINNIATDDQASKTQQNGFVENGNVINGIMMGNQLCGDASPSTYNPANWDIITDNDCLPPMVSQKSETGADANVLTWTPPTVAGSYQIRVTISISAANTATIGWTATWTDSNGNAQTPTNLALFQSGTAAPALTFTTSVTGNYYAIANIDVNNAGTNVVVKTTFSGTSITYKISVSIIPMQ